MNIAKYLNPEYDKLVLDGQVNRDEAARITSMQNAEKIMIDDFVYSGLYYEVAMYIKNPDLNGVVLRSVGNPVDFYNAVMK